MDCLQDFGEIRRSVEMPCLRRFLAAALMTASLAALSGCEPPPPPPAAESDPVETPASPNTTTDEALAPSPNTTTDEALTPAPAKNDEDAAPPSANTTTDEAVPPAPPAESATP
jgi:hypothetical protein